MIEILIRTIYVANCNAAILCAYTRWLIANEFRIGRYLLRTRQCERSCPIIVQIITIVM